MVLAWCAVAAAQESGGAPSNAGNYGREASIAVNSRTAELTFEAELVGLPGITDDIGLSVGLSYSSAEAVSSYESNTRYFGLPYGWKYSISFISDAGTYKQLHIDGSQTYILDSGWRTQFKAAGSNASVPVATGMLQYNRADANFRSDNATISVNGIPSAYRLSTLEGRTRFFSASGLLLQDRDRFGNTISYHYNANTNPQSARLASIIDSWGHTTTFSYCSGGGCEPGQVTITLPDGRTTSFVAPDSTRITKLTDTAGMVTSLTWGNKVCARGENSLVGMTSATGGFMTVEYTCMNVCTQPSSSSCANSGATTTWPVVRRLYSCPNNTSGTTCPNGSPNSDFLVTEYTLGTTGNQNNYTGYPRYSPYAPADPLSDSLMSSNDHTFTYTSVVGQKHADGSIAYQTQSTYNFLHLLTDEAVSVRAPQPGGSFGLSLSKETSYCYGLSSSAPSTGCPTPQVSYQSLPANYQSVITSGSCVYGVDDASPSGQARVSVLTNAYDSFGQTVNTRRYFGTSTSAVTGSCDRATRLDHSRLQLVHDDHMAFDTPSTVDSSQHLNLGAGSGHYGIMKAHQTFSYTEPVDQDVHGDLPSGTPILVQLTCSTLDSSGTVVHEATSGLLTNDSATPTSPGVIAACSSPNFDTSVAPPKTSVFTYDGAGRLLSRATRWADGVTPPLGSVDGTVDTFTYTLAPTQDGEEACGNGGNTVLETTLTDGQGSTTKSRTCTLNAFPLSTHDALGRVTTYRHDQQGMTTLITHPNGTSVAHEYYYACPVAPPAAGSQATCPAGSNVSSGCPYDDQAQKRGCVVQKLLAGADPISGQANQSYVDGVLQVSIKDGLGRVVEVRDNLGGQSGAGYTALQTRSRTVYDDLGRTVHSSSLIGAVAPLVYTTTTAYDSKLRPSLVCSPRGIAQQIAYDDVSQHSLLLHNGTQRQQSITNDSQQDVTTIDCPIVVASTTAAGDCPTVATSTKSAACSGDGYYSYTLHDGAGLEHSRVAGGGNDPKASVAAIQGLPKYSADMLMYGYSATSTAGSDPTTAVNTESTWVRDIQGLPLRMGIHVTDGSNDATTFTSDSYAYDNIGQTLSERNKLSDEGDVTLAETYAYNANRLPVQVTNYAGTTFHTFYDNMDRKTRFCHAAEGGGSEGETMEYDPITGTLLKITHFTNPGDCSVCQDGSCAGDVATDSITYTYTRFGQIASKTYSDGTEMSWAYDEYQRPSCFADAVATDAGHHCPESPTAAGYSPSADQLLTWYTYWPDEDTYRRGLPKSTCRGVRDGQGGFAIKCLDADYYTSVDTGGSCDAGLASVVGAFSGMAKTSSLCTGGSCSDGTGSLVYRTTHLYDAHGRSCSVVTRNAQNNLILGQRYEYDQYNNLVGERSESELDASTDVNYVTYYSYDGLMRLVWEAREDLDGVPLGSTTYKYDAASNIIEKVEEIAEPPGPLRTHTPSHTPTLLGETPPTVTPLATATATTQPTLTSTVTPEPTETRSQVATITPTQVQPTQTPTVVPAGDDDGCSMQPRGSESPALAWLGIGAALLAYRRRQLAGSPHVARKGFDRMRHGYGTIFPILLVGTLLTGCGDSDSQAPIAATATATLPQVGATQAATPTPSPTATRTRGTVPGPGPSCNANTDTCAEGATRLFAIAHSYSDPVNTVLYRVTIPQWSTGGEFGDGTNGFFYRVTIAGHTNETRNYVPFNGIGVASDGSPQLPPFHFIVPVDVANGSTGTTVTIDACAANYATSGGTVPTCSKTLWTNTYNPLPMPSVGPPPFDFVELDFLRNNSVTIPNSGLYPGQLTLTANGISTTQQAQWLADHLVFFDDCLEPYTNDIFDDTSHRSIGVLGIDEALHLNQDGSAYIGKYGDLNPVTAATFPNKQYFFYTLDQQDTSQIEVGVQFLYDQSASCPGYINNTGSSASTCGGFALAAPQKRSASCNNLPSVNPQASIVPQQPNQSTPNAPSLSTQVTAGTQEIRTLYFQPGGGVCSRPVNPLAGSNGRPNYVIRQSSAAGGNFWARSFPNALYYVMPSGFGNCDLRTAAPFCELTSGYAAYIPQYAATDGSFGSLNGGSTAAPVIGSVELADQYELPGLAGSTTNAMIWFDNCGYGYTYEECSACQQKLGTRKNLPTPPNNGKVVNYTVTNQLAGAVVLSKECCASWYQENQNTNPVTWEPPQVLDNGYGAFIGTGRTLTYDTLFNSESWVVYDATSGAKRFKLRVGPDGSHVYSCGAHAGSATVSGSSITLASAGVGTIACGTVGTCPFGLTASQSGSTVTCQGTTSDYILGMEEWSREVALISDTVRLEAWGAGARAGDSNAGRTGGTAGHGGFAMTAYSPLDLDQNMYTYVAPSGRGAATIVTTGPELSLLTQDAAKNVTDPTAAGVLLIAGGGGDGGDLAYDPDDPTNMGKTFGDGGAGAVAIANSPDLFQTASAAGADGKAGDCVAGGSQTGGHGGNSNGFGLGGSNRGSNGLGGFGTGSNWTTGHALIPPSSWSAGHGGSGSGLGGAGGGGFGGGGGVNESGCAGGGGGGGSWAAANTVHDPNAPSSAPSSPNGTGGAVQIVYSKTKVPCPPGVTSGSFENGKLSCLFRSSSASDLTAWINELKDLGAVTGSTAVRLTAWGGQGGQSGLAYPGNGGTVSMVTTIDSLSARNPLAIYLGTQGCASHLPVGACGGTATLVLGGKQLSQIDSTNTDPATQNVLLIAGGGGGGGGGFPNAPVGGDGGSCASSTAGPCAAAGGSVADDYTYGCGWGATGGDSGVGGYGGGDDNAPNGHDGIGGLGGNGPTTTRWAAGNGSITVPSTWTNGNGGTSPSGPYRGSGGGGGFGGGGPGATTSSAALCTGGGGGSWAARSVTNNPYGVAAALSPAGAAGAFEIYLETD